MREAYRHLEFAEPSQAMLLDVRYDALRVLVEDPLQAEAPSSVERTSASALCIGQLHTRWAR